MPGAGTRNLSSGSTALTARLACASDTHELSHCGCTKPSADRALTQPLLKDNYPESKKSNDNQT